MSYFRELPNFQYTSNFKNKQFNTDYIVAKNIFKRAKLREDIKSSVAVFDYYTISNNERPDQVAEKVYGDPELDWVVLTTNNITNVREQWPLDGDTFYNFLLDKYGSDVGIASTHHYETIEVLDEYNRVVVPGKIVVDPPLDFQFSTGIGKSEYGLPSFVNENTYYEISVNLNQFIPVKKRNNEIFKAIVTDIQIENSYCHIKTRGEERLIQIKNDLSNWPTSWGGKFSIFTRNDVEVVISVGDTIFDNDVRINNKLYEITIGIGVTGPVFKFKET